MHDTIYFIYTVFISNFRNDLIFIWSGGFQVILFMFDFINYNNINNYIILHLYFPFQFCSPSSIDEIIASTEASVPPSTWLIDLATDQLFGHSYVYGVTISFCFSENRVGSFRNLLNDHWKVQRMAAWRNEWNKHILRWIDKDLFWI